MKKYIFIIIISIAMSACKQKKYLNNWQKEIVNSFSKGQIFTYTINNADTIIFIVEDIYKSGDDNIENANIILRRQNSMDGDEININLYPDEEGNSIYIQLSNEYYNTSGKLVKGLNYPYKGEKIPTVYYIQDSYYQNDTVFLKPNVGIFHITLKDQPPSQLTMDLIN